MADIIFRDYKERVKKELRSAIDVGMEAIAQAAHGNAERETNILVYETPPSPSYVRTGDLRKFIGHEYVPEEQTAYVGDSIYYAPYVEFGTTRMAERPFLKNSVNNYLDEYKELLEDAIDKLK